MANAERVLREKTARGEGDVARVDAGATALEAAQRMNERKIGSLVVTDGGGRVVGIVTERDILTRVVAACRDAARTRVSEVMTREVVCCGRMTGLEELRALMREKRIRHVPVVEGVEVVGMVSIGDVNAMEAGEMALTIRYLEQYISPG